MKIEIDKAELLKELNCLSSVAGNRYSVVPMTSHILFQCAVSPIRMVANDFDTTMVTLADAEVKAAGIACLPAGKLTSIVKLLNDGKLSITVDESGWAVVKSGSSKYNVPGMNAESFPDEPKNEKPFLIEVPSKTFLKVIEKTSFAMSRSEEGRFNMKCLFLQIAEGKICAVATDGHRLAICSAVLEEDPLDDLETTIPAESIPKLVDLLQSYDGSVSIALDENHIYFKVGKRAFTSNLMVGQYPNYSLMIPKNSPHKVSIDKDRLILGIKRASVMTTRHSSAVKFGFDKDRLLLSVSNSEEGDSDELIEINSEVELTLGLNYHYLLEYIEKCPSGDIDFLMKSDQTQIMVQPAGEQPVDSFYIVMPVRYNA